MTILPRTVYDETCFLEDDPTQELKPENRERRAMDLELNNKRVVITGGSRLVDGGATTSLQI